MSWKCQWTQMGTRWATLYCQTRNLNWKSDPILVRNGGIYSKKINFTLRSWIQSHNYSSKTQFNLPKKRSFEFRRLMGLAKPEKWHLAGAVGLLFVSSAVTLAVPFCLGKVIDVIYTSDTKKMKENLKIITQALVIVFVIGGIANYGRVYIMSTVGQRITQRLRNEVFASILRQEVSFFDKNKTGELVNRLSSDTSLVGQTVSLNISDGLRSAVSSVAGISMMFYVSPQLAFVGLSIVPPVAAMAIVYGRFMKNISRKVQDSLASATQVAEERIANIRTVRAFAQEKREQMSYAIKIDEVLQLAYREATARGIFFGMTGLSGNLVVLAVLHYGGTMTADAYITVGELSAFLLYAAYVGISIGGLSSFYSELMKGLGASTRLWQLIDRIPSIPLADGNVPMLKLHGEIIFDNIRFAYPTRSETQIFKDLNLKVPASSMTAIVGASGSGKSTLGHLLLRLYDPQSGKIFIDGMNIGELSPEWLRNQIGTVTQEPVLFSCSIKDNILYGSSVANDVSEERLIYIAKEANAYEFIRNFPEGFNTIVGERGIMLSGGQKQRIAIARALLKNPRILLLDEATSALDAESEFYVQEALERLMKARTVITIAHRLSTIKMADQIAVLSDGYIAETGTYATLMTIEGGLFRRLVERQTVVADDK